MKKMFLVFFLSWGATVLLSSSVFAGDVNQIKIGSILSTQSSTTPGGGALFLNLPAGVTHESPECGLINNYRYAIKGNDKMLISQALMAFASNRTVDIIGDGNCDAWGDTEQVKYLIVY